jgi:hypothetical protein
MTRLDSLKVIQAVQQFLGVGNTRGYMFFICISFFFTLGLQSMLNSAEAMHEHLTSLCFVSDCECPPDTATIPFTHMGGQHFPKPVT